MEIILTDRKGNYVADIVDGELRWTTDPAKGKRFASIADGLGRVPGKFKNVVRACPPWGYGNL